MKDSELNNRIGFSAQPGLIAKIHLAAEQEDMSISEYIRQAVRSQLRKTEREHKAAA